MTVAVVTNECQRGSIGDQAVWPALRDAAKPMLPHLERLLNAARATAVPVAHIVVSRREDLRGANHNAPLFRATDRRSGFITGTPSAELVPELGPHATDLVFPKTHGVTSLQSTGIDAALRNLDVDEIVLGGVSVNVAICALAFEGVNLGYRITVPVDAVAGVPPSYANDVIEHTLRLVATITTTDDLIARLR